MSVNTGESDRSHRYATRPSERVSLVDHEKEPKSNDGSLSSMFALDIAINKYRSASVTNLEGAVADADDMKNYLLERLGVPESNITSLRDEQATRARIIKELRAFQDDPRIQKNDPILIYYAGHGGTCVAPPEWPVGNSNPKIELIVPYDYTDKCDKSVTMVYGIPDHTIGRCIAQLANAKGNNITVIFDCCHSASGTRGPRSDSDKADEDGRVRELDSFMTIPADLDSHIFSEGSPNRSSFSLKNEGARSHILLAACGVNEKAWEFKKRGAFTKALLEMLRSESVDLRNITYKQLIKELPTMKSQNPQCEGYYKDRILFKSEVEDKDASLHHVCKSETGEYQMNVGSIYGITNGAQFEIYRSRDLSMPVVGTLVAKAITPHSTTLVVPDPSVDDGIGEYGFARQITPDVREPLLIHIASNPGLKKLFDEVLEKIEKSKDANRPHISRADIDKAPLRVSLEGDRVVFHVEYKFPSGSILYRLSNTVCMKASTVYSVLWRAAFYFHHLHRSDSSHTRLLSKIKVEFLELEMDLDSLELRTSGRNLNVNGIVKIDATSDGQDIPYGIKINNLSQVDMYVYIFIFNSDLSIETYYSPGVASGQADFPLVKQGSLTLGYGPAAARPIAFTRLLNDKRKTDVAYIKMLFSTQSVELPQITQSSPFLQGDVRGLGVYTYGKHGFWDTLVLPIISRCPSGID